LVNGGDLFQQLQKKTHLSEKQAMFYGAEVVLALKFMHSNGILYRDLKPENVLLDESGHIKISDFGISTKLTEQESKSTTIIGTAQYMAPEVFNAPDGYSFSYDLWSLGCFLYELVVGEPPFGMSASTH